MIDPRLTDSVVLITGANNPHGIGAAIARAFAGQGTRVLLSYLRLSPSQFGMDPYETSAATEPGSALYHALRAKTAATVTEDIKAQGGWVEAREANIAIPEQVADLFDWAERTAGPVDILINNAAAYQEPDTVFTASHSTYRSTFDVNVGGTLMMITEFVRRFKGHKRTSGSIINLSTDAAQTFAGQVNYGASKAAVEALTRSIAIEAGPLGIRVNAIAPGPTQSGYLSAELEAALTEQIPLRRIGDPTDIADVAVFLASDQARWVTGQVIKASGGHAL